MLTSALITLVKKRYPDWSDVLIIEMLNELHKYVFTQVPVERMRMTDSTTGKDPVLTTSQGTYEYLITTTAGFSNNAWRVVEVYQKAGYPIDVICYDAVNSSNGAKIVFREDPGVQNYFVKAYRFPTEINSATKQLEIPSTYHLTHVYDGLVGIVEKFRSGRSEIWEQFEKVKVPDLIKKMSDSPSISKYSPVGGY